MANLTEYVRYSEQESRCDCMETYYSYRNVFNNLKYESEEDSFSLWIRGKQYTFDYEVHKYPGLLRIVRIPYLKEQKYGTTLYNDEHFSKNLDKFIRQYKKDRLNRCLPLRFFRTLLQTFFFRPVGWLKTNLGMDES